MFVFPSRNLSRDEVIAACVKISEEKRRPSFQNGAGFDCTVQLMRNTGAMRPVLDVVGPREGMEARIAAAVDRLSDERRALLEAEAARRLRRRTAAG